VPADPTRPEPFDLTGRTALVTGSGSADGIGFATARMLGRLGARVGIVATTGRVHNRAAELAELRIEALGVVADLTDATAVDQALSAVRHGLGPVAVLVNNAGMTSQARPVLGADVRAAESGGILDLAPDEWRAAIGRNLDTAYLVTRAALPDMVTARWGRVVMVTSVTGPLMAMRAEAAYAAAKAGMVGLMRSVAVDHAVDGITCNAVAPGWIATGSQTEDEVHQATTTPVGRAGTPDEVALAVASLCLPGAGYLTGRLLAVDGGNAIAEERA
jgi:3-oxoacyl-[acyl-carrier protein] reductase